MRRRALGEVAFWCVCAWLAVVGAWWYVDYHKHTCLHCRRRWGHSGLLTGHRHEHHTCSCGETRFIRDG